MARPRTAVTNPPSTGYSRPEERKFWVWRDRGPGIDTSTAERWGRETHLWRWCCTLCDPPSHGLRGRKGAWAAIVTVSMPRHFRVRHYHHQWAASKPRALLLPLAHTCVLWLVAVGGTVATTRERTPPVTYQPPADQLDAMTSQPTCPIANPDTARMIAQQELYRAWRATRTYDTVMVVDPDPADIGYRPQDAKLEFWTMPPAQKQGQVNVITLSEDEARELRAELTSWLKDRAQAREDARNVHCAGCTAACTLYPACKATR